MKIILVKGCLDCPYGAMWKLDGSQYMCEKGGKINRFPSKPLDDCPLKDAAVIKNMCMAITNA